MPLIDLTGRRFDRLQVLRRTEDQTLSSGRRLPRWLCACDCGTVWAVSGNNLRNGSTLSCGCLNREKMAAAGRANRKPGRVSYSAAHRRVRNAKGSARLLACVDCANAALEWSYDHDDPNEWFEPHQRTGRLVAYSGEVMHYQPRCKACHEAFDRGRSDSQAQH